MTFVKKMKLKIPQFKPSYNDSNQLELSTKLRIRKTHEKT